MGNAVCPELLRRRSSPLGVLIVLASRDSCCSKAEAGESESGGDIGTCVLVSNFLLLRDWVW